MTILKQQKCAVVDEHQEVCRAGRDEEARRVKIKSRFEADPDQWQREHDGCSENLLSLSGVGW